MAAFNFPNSPSTNDIHTENNVSWKWNGTVWKKIASPDTIAKADSKVQVVDAGTGGYITAETDGTQRLRVENSGAIVTGVLTATSADFSGAVSVGGVLTYEDVKNVDSIGIITARSGAEINNGDLKVGTAVTISSVGNITLDKPGAGIITATKYYGDGSSLSNVTSTTINNNADNRVITGSGTANTLNGEADLTFDGNTLTHTVGANTHRIQSIAAGNHYTTLEFNSNRSSAADILSIIDFKWDGDKVADILALAGADTSNKDDGHLVFRTSPSQGSIAERLRITSSGFIGVGVASPNHMLQLHRSDSENSYTQYTNATTGSAASDGVWLGMGSDEVCYLWQQENNHMILGTNNTERLRIANNAVITATQANSAIGLIVKNTAHDSQLQILATAANKNSVIWFGDNDDGNKGWIDYDHNTDEMSFRVNGSTRAWFDSSNTLYLQGTSHTNLEVRSNSSSTKGVIQTVQDSDVRMGATTNHPLALYAGTTERVRILNDGRVLIGTTTGAAFSSRKLTVSDTTSGGTTAIEIRSATNGTGRLYFTDSTNSSDVGSYAGKVLYDHTDNHMGFWTNGSNERFRITASGTAVFGGNSAAPIVDNGELYFRGNSTQTFESLPQSFYLYGDSLGSNTANAGTGMVFGGKYDTSGNYTTFAGIHGIKENTTSGQYGGALVFGIRKDGGGVWERLRITTEGVNITCGRANAPKASHAILNLGYDSGETRGLDIYGGWSTGEIKSINFPHGSNTADLVGSFDCKHNGGSSGSSFRWGRLYHLGNSSTYPMTLDSINTTTARLNLDGASPHINGHNYMESCELRLNASNSIQSVGNAIQFATRFNTNSTLISINHSGGTGSGTRITFPKAVYIFVSVSQDVRGSQDTSYWSQKLVRSGSIEGYHLIRMTTHWDNMAWTQGISVPANGWIEIQWNGTNNLTAVDANTWSHYHFMVWQNV